MSNRNVSTRFTFRKWLATVACAATLSLQPLPASAATILATGQLLIENTPGTHDDVRENRVYAIDTKSGVAVPLSPSVSGLPAALALSGSQLVGFASGRVVSVDPHTGVVTPMTSSNGLNSTGFDVTPDGRGFILPFNANFDTQQLHQLALGTGIATPLGSLSQIGDAVDTARGTPLGTAQPFVIGLGSIGDTLYGVDLDTNTLIALVADTGFASVVGQVGNFGIDPRFSGYAAMTGVDEDLDGDYDTLYTNVNFFDDDSNSATPTLRLGGLGRVNLTDGTWELVGTNPGIIFFGFAPAPIPEPATASLATLSMLVLLRRRRR